MIGFTAIDRTTIAGRGVVATVELDRDTHDFGHLVGAVVCIDDRPVRCIGVERFAHNPPWRKGEKVGLLYDPDLKPALPTEDRKSFDFSGSTAPIPLE